jgi:DNA-binding transcriptional regulator YhcF (GntR family)
MDIQIDKTNRKPLNEQLKDQIRGLIQTGQIKNGVQLPTIRELAALLSVNVNTIALAYRDLTNEGMIISKRGKGTFVAGAPGDRDLQRLKDEKLMNMIASLTKETDRLGYSRDEVELAIHKYADRDKP